MGNAERPMFPFVERFGELFSVGSRAKVEAKVFGGGTHFKVTPSRDVLHKPVFDGFRDLGAEFARNKDDLGFLGFQGKAGCTLRCCEDRRNVQEDLDVIEAAPDIVRACA